MGAEHLDEHVGPELLQVVEAHEDGGHLLDGVVEGRLVEEQVLPARGPGQHPRHLTGGPEKVEVVCDRRVHALGEEAHHVFDAELPRAEVGVRCPFDVELCRSSGVVRAGLSHGPIPDQRRLDIVDQAQTLVAVPQPLLEEGEQQPVALGRARVERAEVRSWPDSADPGDPEAQTVHGGHRSPDPRDRDSTLRAFGTGSLDAPGWLPRRFIEHVPGAKDPQSLACMVRAGERLTPALDAASAISTPSLALVGHSRTAQRR